MHISCKISGKSQEILLILHILIIRYTYDPSKG